MTDTRIRRRRRCPCGAETRAQSGICPNCRGIRKRITNALPPGRWVPTGRGILVYRTANGLPYRDEEAA